MSIESGTDGHTLANILERGTQIAQSFPDHTISEIEASHIYNPSLRMAVAPYAIRPEIVRIFLLSAMDGKPITGNPDEPNFLVYNLRLANNVTFPDGTHGQVTEVANNEEPTYNTRRLPFPPEKIAATRRVGEALANMNINVSSLKVSYPLPTASEYPVTAEVLGDFGSNRDFYNFEDTASNRLVVLSLEEEVNKHNVRITNFACATHDGTIPINFTMYQNLDK
mgnify:CR=1 FL=1